MYNLKKNHKIYVAGSNGMVGTAICNLLNKKGFTKQKNKKYIIYKPTPVEISVRCWTLVEKLIGVLILGY